MSANRRVRRSLRHIEIVVVTSIILALGGTGSDDRQVRGSEVPALLEIEEGGLLYVYHVVSGTDALFDSRSDPDNLRNLFSTHTDRGLRLRRKLERKLGVESLEEFREGRRREIEALMSMGYL